MISSVEAIESGFEKVMRKEMRRRMKRTRRRRAIESDGSFDSFPSRSSAASPCHSLGPFLGLAPSLFHDLDLFLHHR